MRLFIEPNDVLFFRDGRPFDAGGDHVARLAFPPSPVTFYGAIRSAIIGQNFGNFAEFVGSETKSSPLWQAIGNHDKLTLRIADFGLARRSKEGDLEKLYPMPGDLVKVKDLQEYLILKPEPELEEDSIKMNFPHRGLRTLGHESAVGKYLEAARGFLSYEGLKAYMEDQSLNEDLHIVRESEIYKPENRVGIAREKKTHTSKEGHLYGIEFARLRKGVGFLVELEGLSGLEENLRQHCLLRLGGESRSARYTIDPSCRTFKPNETPLMRFKLVLQTPAVFPTNWIPSGIDSASLVGQIDAINPAVTLLAAAVGRPVGLGGWDIVNKQSKPTRRAVPAGSVYYFTCQGKTSEFKKYSFIHIGLESQQGLGQAIIGGW